MSKPKIYQINPLRTKRSFIDFDFNEKEKEKDYLYNQDLNSQDDFIYIKKSQYIDLRNYLFNFKKDLNSLSENYNKIEQCNQLKNQLRLNKK
jgi:hypothetical protein